MSLNRNLLVCAIALTSLRVSAQPLVPWFLPGNSVLTGLEYLGCDGTSLTPLHIKTIPDLQIDFSTSDIERFRLLPDNTYATLGGYSGIIANGFSLHSPDVAAFYTGGAPGPFSLEHLAAALNSSYADAFRNWAQTGTTYTGGNSMGYVGQKAGDAAHTDMVVQIAKREGPNAPDRFRTIFTSELNTSSTGGADSQEGLEGMRQVAVSNTRVNTGLGFSSAIVGEPDQTLDLAVGKARIRELPTDPVSISDEVVMVDMVTGLLEHRPANTLFGSCEWYRNTTPAARYVLSGTTAPVPTSVCPDCGWRYAIGTTAPLYKMELYHNDVDRVNSGGFRSTYLVSTTTPLVSGIQSTVVPTTAGAIYPFAYGIRGEVTSAQQGYGVDGAIHVNHANSTSVLGSGVWGRMEHSAGTLATGYGVRGSLTTSGTVTNGFASYGLAYGYGSANITNMHGVYGESSLYAGTAANAYGVKGTSSTYSGTITNNYGVWGCANKGINNYSVYGCLPTVGTVNWSGFFVGDISASGMAFPSDQNLKTEIQDLDNAMDLLMDLHPKSYRYRQDEYPQMGLPQGQRYGFIAQDVQAVFPQFVKNSHQPANVDSLGNELSAAVDYLALNTGDITSILVGAVQRQHMQLDEAASELAETQATNAALNDQLQQVMDRLDAMEQSVSNCCADRGAIQNGGVEIDEKSLNSNDRYLRIAPNPFETQTKVYYQLDQAGRMQLVANSADGKQLQVLQEANLEAGNYQYEWNTGDLAPGVYYVTLLVDAKPITKRAVKILR